MDLVDVMDEDDEENMGSGYGIDSHWPVTAWRQAMILHPLTGFGDSGRI